MGLCRRDFRSLLKTAFAATLAMLLVTSAVAGTALADGKNPPPSDAPAAKEDAGGKQEGGMATGASQDSASSCTLSFADVRTADWYYSPVTDLACAGIIGGYADGTFRPHNPVTRAQVAKMVVNAMGWAVQSPGANRFRDVPVGSAYFAFVETAAARGIISGYADGTFRPGDKITRAQFSKVVVAAKGWEPCASCPQHFSDVSPGNPFFGYVEAAVANGVVSGYADRSFRPGQEATRAQFSAVLSAALAPKTITSITVSSEERATVELINNRRAARGLGPLVVNAELTSAARRHSSDVGPRGLCQHAGTDGSSPWSRADDAGYTGFASGEVVGCNYRTPTDAVNGWWGSSAHFDILTSANVNEIGCGWWISSGGTGWQTCLTGKR